MGYTGSASWDVRPTADGWADEWSSYEHQGDSAFGNVNSLFINSLDQVRGLFRADSNEKLGRF